MNINHINSSNVPRLPLIGMVSRDQTLIEAFVLDSVEVVGRMIKLAEASGLDYNRVRDCVLNGQEVARKLATSNELPPPILGNARDLIWFLAALAARTGEEHISGVYRIDDQDQKIYNFLASFNKEKVDEDKKGYSRISTHFRQDHNKELESKKQSGIDMNTNDLPGAKKAILFDFLNDRTTFIKIENHGFPPTKSFNAVKEVLNHSKDYLKHKYVGKATSSFTSRREDIDSNYKNHYKNTLVFLENFIKNLPKETTKTSEKELKNFKEEGLEFGLTKMNENLHELRKKCETWDNNPEISSEQKKDLKGTIHFIEKQINDIKAVIAVDRGKGYEGERRGSEVVLPSLRKLFVE